MTTTQHEKGMPHGAISTLITIDGKECYLSGIRLEHLQRYPYTITAFNIYRVVGSCEVFERETN